MADVFISYAREDCEFVRRLHAALTAREIGAWVDWEGIRPTAEWLQSVYAAIDEAGAFLFVISFASVESDECKRELQHAVERSKKLVPVMLDAVAPDCLPSELAARHWILFRDGDFDAGITSLVAALTTDLEWVELHTRLLVRAVEWEKNGGDKSFLLRGTNLGEAERWLARGTVKDQAPTPLHAQYVMQSRRAASRRQRALLGSVSVALLIATVLSILLFVQYRESEQLRQAEQEQRRIAEEQRDEAQRAREGETQQRQAAERSAREATEQARISRLRGLAAEGQFLVGVPGRQEAAVASAVLASALARDDDEQALATGALHSILDQTRGARLSRTGMALRPLYDPLTRSSGGSPMQFVVDAVISSANSRAATLYGDGSATLWDARFGERIADLRRDQLRLVALSFVSGGKALAGEDKAGIVQAWDSATAAVICTSAVAPDREPRVALAGNSGPAASATDSPCEVARNVLDQKLARDQAYSGRTFLSPDGSLLVLPSARNGVRILRTTTRDPVQTLATNPKGDESETYVNIVRVSPDNKYVFTAGDGRPTIWDLASGAVQAVLVGQGTINAADFSSDGRRIVTASTDGTARVWSSLTGRELLRLSGHVNSVSSASFSEDNRWVVTGSADGTARVWNVIGGAVISTRQVHNSWVRRIVASQSGDRVAIAGYFAPLQIWDLESGRAPATIGGLDSELLSFSSNDSELLSAAGEHLTVTRLRDGRVRRWSGTLRSIQAAAFVTGDQVIAISGDGIAMRDMETGRTVWRVADRGAEGHRVVVLPSRRNVITGHLDGRVQVWRIGDEASSASWQTGSRITSLVLSPDGRRLLTGGDDGVARVWDIDRRTLVLTLGRHQGAVASATFSRDGSLVLTTGSDATGVVFDALTGARVSALSGHHGAVLEGMFSNDGHRVLTRSADGTAKIWHARSGQLLASIDAHGGGLTAAVFVNNGNHVLTGGQDGVAVLHEATHAGMVQLACDRLRHQVEWTAVKDACPSSATASTVRPASTR